ncbi:MAG TPA: alpha/beta hydrolase [Solirubrobacteraceae bacterium]|nr:alpha/beta hydrolase [Solirubrobacteraceae bacterium]
MDSPGGRPLVLVPGACLGGWAWEQVGQLLRERGHPVYPVTLTSLGERVHLADPAVDLDTHVTDVVNVLDYEDLHDAIVVGHSYAGPVVGAVADRRPERLNAVVYLDTGPLPDGAAIVDVQPPELRERQLREAQEGGDGWRWPVPGRQTLESGVFGSTSGLEEQHFEWLAERGTPHPYASFTTRVRLTGEADGRPRRVAIFCSAGGMDVETLRELIVAGDPRAATFADPDWELHELSTGHWPMFSLPGPLAELLHELAERP